MALIMRAGASVMGLVVVVSLGCAPCRQTIRTDPGDCAYTLALVEEVSHEDMWQSTNGILADDLPFSVPERARREVFSSYFRAMGKRTSDLAPDGRIGAFAVSPAGICVLDAGGLRLFDARTGELAWTRAQPSAESGWIQACRWTIQNELLIVEGSSSQSELIRLSAAGDVLATVQIAAGSSGALLSEDGNTVVVGRPGRQIEIVDAATGSRVARIEQPRLQMVGFASRSAVLVSIHAPPTINLRKRPGCLRVWDASNGKQIGSAADASYAYFTYMMPTHDPHVLFVGSLGQPWQLLDVRDLQLCTLGEETKAFEWFWLRSDGSGFALKGTGEAWSIRLEAQE